MAELAQGLSKEEVSHDATAFAEPDMSNRRAPKLSTQETQTALNRGPYLGRLRAQRRILELTLRFTSDEVTRSSMDMNAFERIREEISKLATELEEFDILHTNESSTAVGAEHATAEVSSMPQPDSSEVVYANFEDTSESTPLNQTLPGSQHAEPPKIKSLTHAEFLKRRETAICAETDPEIFYPEKGGSTREAKRICNEICELTDVCLKYAVSNDEQFGIWGGMSARDRRILKKSQKKTG